MIIKAAHLAEQLHRRQVRKGSGAPYITHPARVAARATLLPFATDTLVAAAWLHDTVEDCGIMLQDLALYFNEDVARLVEGMTNAPKVGEYGRMNRAQRKMIDRQRLANCEYRVRMLKAIDRLDNIREASQLSAEFARHYAQESLLLFQALFPADSNEPHKEIVDLFGAELLQLTEPLLGTNPIQS